MCMKNHCPWTWNYSRRCQVFNVRSEMFVRSWCSIHEKYVHLRWCQRSPAMGQQFAPWIYHRGCHKGDGSAAFKRRFFIISQSSVQWHRDRVDDCGPTRAYPADSFLQNLNSFNWAIGQYSRHTARSSLSVLNQTPHALTMASWSFVRWGMSLSCSSSHMRRRRLRNSGHSMTLIDWEVMK